MPGCWFKGLQAVAKKVGIKTVYDLSATPYYLKGSGYNEGFIFPWVVSDFSLMDAIEAGIVKVPRIPVDDDATANLVTYLRLWDHVGDEAAEAQAQEGRAPTPSGSRRTRSRARCAASTAATRSRSTTWEQTLAPLGEPPPVMIVVCPNTIVSKLVYDWIAGADVERRDDGDATRAPARRAAAAVERRRRRRWLDAPAHDPDRLGAARVAARR